jgi:hypothetical protein
MLVVVRPKCARLQEQATSSVNPVLALPVLVVGPLWCAMRLATSKVNSVHELPALLAVVLLWPVAMQATSKVDSAQVLPALSAMLPRVATLQARRNVNSVPALLMIMAMML